MPYLRNVTAEVKEDANGPVITLSASPDDPLAGPMFAAAAEVLIKAGRDMEGRNVASVVKWPVMRHGSAADPGLNQ